MWYLSSWTRGSTHVPCTGRQILHHWTTREVPGIRFLTFKFWGDTNMQTVAEEASKDPFLVPSEVAWLC